MSEENETTETSDFEKRFFEDQNLDPGAPLPDDYVDPELLSLDSETAFSQLLLVLLLGVLAGILAWQYRTELLYVFTPTEALELGHADEIQFNEDWIADGEIDLPSNRYVSVDGVAEWPSAAGNHQFYKLLGAQIYVQINPSAYADEEVDADYNPNAVPWGEASYRPMHEEPGRLIAFEDLPRRYESMIQFYSDNYGVHYCGFEPSLEYQRFLNNQRGRIELILLNELGREPTEDEISERLGPLSGCRRAYLLVSGASPASYRYFIALYAALVLVLLGSGFVVVRRLIQARSRAASRR